MNIHKCFFGDLCSFPELPPICICATVEATGIEAGRSLKESRDSDGKSLA